MDAVRGPTAVWGILAAVALVAMVQGSSQQPEEVVAPQPAHNTNPPPSDLTATQEPGNKTPIYIVPVIEVAYTSAGPIARVPEDLDWKRLASVYPVRRFTNVTFYAP